MEDQADGGAGPMVRGVQQAWSVRRAASVGALVAVLLLCTVVARLSGHDMASTPPPDQVDVSQTWLAGHDYRMIVELDGAHRVNVSAARHADAEVGDVQTVSAHGEQQIGYYRFRLRNGALETTTGGRGSPWRPATPEQATFVRHVTDPSWLLAPFRTSGRLRDRGVAGDAEMFSDAHDDLLFMIEGRPLQGVVSSPAAGSVRAFRIDPT